MTGVFFFQVEYDQSGIQNIYGALFFMLESLSFPLIASVVFVSMTLSMKSCAIRCFVFIAVPLSLAVSGSVQLKGRWKIPFGIEILLLIDLLLAIFTSMCLGKGF